MGKIPTAHTPEARKRVFGRKIGRPLSGSRQDVLDTMLPELQVPAEQVTEKADIAFSTLFGNDKPVVFEIGFGNGEHLKAMMEQRSDRNYIGAEPFINGMSAFLKSIDDQPRDHVRVWMDDAIALIRSFPAESLDIIYILNPDPWPKSRHHKRRIVRADTLAEYHRTLKPGGRLVMATDVDALAEWMVTETVNHGGFEWEANRAADWQTMPEDWFLTTRYAAKGVAAGRRESYLLFKKA